MSQVTYVALGDSLTAGRGDLDNGKRPVGWAQRLCRMLEERSGQSYEFINLGVPHATVAEVAADQVPVLAGAGADLVTVWAGMNDIRGGFEPGVFAREVDELFERVAVTAPTVATMTLPNIVSILPLPKELLGVARQLIVRANDAIRTAADAHGLLYVDAWYAPEVAEPGFWDKDRLYPNAHGHAVIAGAFSDLLLAGAPDIRK